MGGGIVVLSAQIQCNELIKAFVLLVIRTDRLTKLPHTTFPLGRVGIWHAFSLAL